MSEVALPGLARIWSRSGGFTTADAIEISPMELRWAYGSGTKGAIPLSELDGIEICPADPELAAGLAELGIPHRAVENFSGKLPRSWPELAR